MIICFIVCVWITYFCWGRILGMGAWGPELADRSNFFHDLFSKHYFYNMIQIIQFDKGMGEWGRESGEVCMGMGAWG